ncbi:MAG: AAA family ATPase [Rickettsiales bacterium]|nr:AAA family ATPase [Rickettsiales bacterium]
MYESHYGLSAKPFSLLPDAHFLYFSKRHKRVVNLLEYGTITQSGFMVISGDVGAGKTTVIRHFLKNLESNVTVGVITNPSQTLGNLLGWIAGAFDLPNYDNDQVKMYNSFIEFLLMQYANGKRTVLIIDEAQNMTAQMLEDLRMLSNVNNERDQLLQMILVGQPELLDTLNKPELRQFVQRIAVHCHLTPLTAQETAAYIRHRLSVVGGSPDLFDDMACAAVYFFTYGVPRLINLLCDQALMYAFAEDEETVSFHTVTEVVGDRNSSGLSSFRPVGDEISEEALMAELETILTEIRKPPTRTPKTAQIPQDRKNAS